jgi:hypothetical protein
MDEHSQHTNGNGKSSDRDTPETMFDSLKVAAGDLAERAAPTVRELSARAAELTATAANKAAPFARKAGAATADASLKLAESARGWAADLRAREADAATAGDVSTADDAWTGAGAATAVAEPPVSEAVFDTTPPEDLAPSDLAADEPPAAGEPAPFESTAESEAASPAFEEDRPSDDRPLGSPGI